MQLTLHYRSQIKIEKKYYPKEIMYLYENRHS